MSSLLHAPLLSMALSILGCAGTQTQMGSVSRDQVVIEQARQQQFALELEITQQSRLFNVAQPLLRAAAPFCGKKVKPTVGLIALNANVWKKDVYAAALAAGFNDTLTLATVVPGMPAARSGLRAGDRILAINGRHLLTGANALSDFSTAISRNPAEFTVHYRRGADTSTARVRTDMSCSYATHLVSDDEVNAYADGKAIYFTKGILRFLADDDDLAVVVGHEIAHDAMNHIDSKKTNSLVGALLGAVMDIAAATQGINTQGDFASQGAQLGAMVFSQDFEREADYVGLYILALSGRPIEKAAGVWRLMGAAKPGAIKFASSHPTSAERFVRLDTWRGEISRKVASGAPLIPEMTDNAKAVAFQAAATQLRTAAVASGQVSTSFEETKSVAASSMAAAPAESRSIAAAAPARPTTSAAPIVHQPPATIRERESSRTAEAVIGAPSSELARAQAIDAFAEGQRHMQNHNWVKAEASFRRTLQFDGSLAKYHAALGSVLLLLHKWEDAEVEYTAAVLLDLDNADYRKMVKRARSRR